MDRTTAEAGTPASARFPWARPRHERLLLLLVAVATLTVVQPHGAQDVSRMCLTLAVPHARLSNDSCLAGNGDLASFGGHSYSDKAPGLSFLAIPIAEAVRLPPPTGWEGDGALQLWAVRISTGGIALLGCAMLLGRVAEGLASRSGGPALVTFAAGTLMSSLAAANFDEAPAALLGFAAFLLAWRRRPVAAGIVGGAAILVEYQAALIVAVIALYVAFGGVRSVGRYLLGLLPGVALLGLYDWAAFGSPLHLSYRYVSVLFAAQQSQGFFGIHAPRWHAIRLVLVGDRGLVVDAPVLLLALAGLAILWRQGLRRESAVCAIVTLSFLVLEFGYYDPYGGHSPGPRFFIPALPFLALGLAPAFARWRTATSLLALCSVLASSGILLSWPAAVNTPGRYHWSIWRELALVPVQGEASEIARWAPANVLTKLGVGPLGAEAAVFAASVAALGLALWAGRARATRAGA
ncbi:MAG TPA: hypothetical protein VMV08_07605 [Gaiellaceae bacterium]|nr:hypothetical protein [Gaiellaceae bacterium]